MKRTVIAFACLMLAALTANAQLDGLLRKAAQKATEKVTKTAEEAIEKELNKNNKHDDSSEVTETKSEQLTYASIMAQLPSLPTVQQLVSFKEAELNEQTLKMMASTVSSFRMKVTSLSMRAIELTTSGIDSAQLSEMAERSTGLSHDEIEMLSTMTEEEQESYLKAHYMNGYGEKALVKEAAEVSKYLEPIQPIIDQWDKVGASVDELFAKAKAECSTIYAKYAEELSKTEGKEHNKVLLSYYSEVAPIMRDAVMKAMQIRQSEQLPIAEQIEQEMVGIRAQHNDLTSSLVNYPLLTTQSYFMDLSYLWEIPTDF